MQVVPVAEAEAVFRGKITNVYTTAVAHLTFQSTIETRLYVTISVRCEDAGKGTVLWQDTSMTYYQVYLQDPDPLVSFTNRRQALEFIAGEMATRIHDRFLSNF